MKLILSILFFNLNYFSIAQSHEIDSLKEITESDCHDTTKIKALYEWDGLIYFSDPELDNDLNLQIIDIATRNLKSCDVKSEIKFYKSYLILSYNVLGINQDNFGNYQLALDHYYTALALGEELKDSSTVGGIYNNIGLIHEKLNDYESARSFYLKSLRLEQESNDIDGVVTAYNNIGNLYLAQKMLDSSLYNYKLGLQIGEGVCEDYQLASTYGNVGVAFDKMKEFDSAIFYYDKSLIVRERINDWDGMTHLLANLGLLHNQLNHPNLAIKHCSEGLKIALENQATFSTATNCNCLYQAYKLKNNSDSALYYFEQKDSLNAILTDDDTKRVVAQKEIIYQNDKQNLVDSLSHAVEIELQLADHNKEKAENNLRITFLIGGLIFLALIGTLIYYRLNVTKKQKLELEKQHKLSKIQNEIISEQKFEIDQSINYAKLIQDATLPTLNLSDIFRESFLLYKPKDTVSGDFYWIEENEKYKFFSVADCTGHGIPGAFISMIGTILLNEIHNSKELSSPELILNELNRLIQLTLDSGNHQMKDGMDISFCTLNKENNILSYAGANNPLWIISKKAILEVKRDNKFETIAPNISLGLFNLFEIKADKFPVGKYYGSGQSFNLKQVQLHTGDVVYNFTDGFADQFGGENGKKYKYKPFKRFLLKNAKENLAVQSKLLETEFSQWKGTLEQLDDVCIMGIKV